jgi:hypothetical protein
VTNDGMVAVEVWLVLVLLDVATFDSVHPSLAARDVNIFFHSFLNNCQY